MMETMRRVAAGIVMAAAFAWTGFAETVTNVRGMQRENSNLVDIYYDLESTDGGSYTVEVVIEGRTNEVTAATFSGDVGDGVTPGRNRHILWDAGADWPGKKGDVKAIVTVTKESEKGNPGSGVQLWEGGPYWADRNIGASAPEDYGYYFWWGDTVGYTRSGGTWTDGYYYSGVTWVSSTGERMASSPFNSSTCPTYNKSISTLQSEGWIVSQGGTYVLAPEHDAAQVQWGGGWRMPTYQELYDLCWNKCDWTWTTRNGVNGYVVRGRGDFAANSIFLPCAGHGYGTSLYYAGSGGYDWSSVPDSDRNYAYGLWFSSGYHGMGYNGRYGGQPVRPVSGFTN